jgi:hypothetical protein
MRSRNHDTTCFRGCAMRDAATAANADDRPQSSRRALTPLEAAIATGLPCFPCGKQKSPAIPGPRGHKHATDNPAALRALWRRHPGPLVGVRTGETSGLSVMDIDGPRHPEQKPGSLHIGRNCRRRASEVQAALPRAVRGLSAGMARFRKWKSQASSAEQSGSAPTRYRQGGSTDVDWPPKRRNLF